jgi:DNA invertase Pin-like site-specific DNA recombinase
MPTRTIAYLRVSTEKQVDRGVSLDAQRAKVKGYAQLYDLDLVEVIVDAGESANSQLLRQHEHSASLLNAASRALRAESSLNSARLA